MPLTDLLQKAGQTKAEEAFAMLVHALAKVGKTTFASTFPKPVICDLENGTNFLTRKVDVIPWARKDFTAIMSDMDAICAEKHSFKTIVIDSIDWLEGKIEDDVCKANGVSTINEIQWGKGRGLAMLRLGKFLEKLTYLKNEKGMNVLLLAHSAVKRIEDPVFPAYDKWGLKMNDKSSALVCEWSDIIGYMSFKTEILKEEGSWGKTTNKAGGSDQRILSCTHKPAYLAGNRMNLPEELEPSYDALVSAMKEVLK